MQIFAKKKTKFLSIYFLLLCMACKCETRNNFKTNVKDLSLLPRDDFGEKLPKIYKLSRVLS